MISPTALLSGSFSLNGPVTSDGNYVSPLVTHFRLVDAPRINLRSLEYIHNFRMMVNQRSMPPAKWQPKSSDRLHGGIVKYAISVRQYIRVFDDYFDQQEEDKRLNMRMQIQP
jgi:hypothetical protein